MQLTLILVILKHEIKLAAILCVFEYIYTLITISEYF